MPLSKPLLVERGQQGTERARPAYDKIRHPLRMQEESMFCSSCGKEIPVDARFCAHCGTQVGGYYEPVRPPVPGLYRSRSQRMIAGLCGGLSATYGWDLSVVRLIAVLGLLFSGPVIFSAYIIAWMVVPEEPFFTTPVAPPVTAPSAAEATPPASSAI
jgi:phage shock protein C